MLIQYKCMPPSPPTRFYRLGAPREDGAEITCPQSSVSMALFLRSPHNILFMLRFIQMVFCLSVLQVNPRQRRPETKRFGTEVKLRRLSRSSNCLCKNRKKLSLSHSESTKVLHLIMMTSVQDVLL